MRSRKMLFPAAWILVGCSAAPTINQKVFEPVYRAAKTIEGATGPGVTYPKFGELLQQLNTELVIARDQVKSDDEKKLLAQFGEVLEAYNFSMVLWKQKLEHSRSVVPGKIFLGWMEVDPELAPNLTKYGLKPNAPDGSTSSLTIDDDAIQRTWSKAGEALKRATDAYYGRPTTG